MIFKVQHDLEDFTVEVDESIRKEICAVINEKIEEIRDFEDTYIHPHTDNNISVEDANKVLCKMLEIYDGINEEYIKKIVKSFPKKKNGTFKKNLTHVIGEDRISYYSEDEYGYAFHELRFKCIDHTVLKLQLVRTVEGY